MKVLPKQKKEKEQDTTELTQMQAVSRWAALLLAFGSVFFFFFKILFF